MSDERPDGWCNLPKPIELVSIPEDELKRLLEERDLLRQALTHAQDRCNTLLEEAREARKEAKSYAAMLDALRKLEFGKP